MNLNGIFNPENKFWSFMDKIMNLCVLALFWFLFSIPVITAGASTAALFGYTLKLAVNEEGYVWRTFVRSFKENFFQATILWLGVLAVGGFLGLDFYLCRFLNLGRTFKIVLFFALVSITLVYLLTIIYIFPLLAFFRLPLRRIVPHAFIMSVGNLYVSVTILVIYGISAALTYWIPMLFMVWFSLASFVASHFYRHVFEKYVTEEA